MPNGTELHVGFFAPQSKHIYSDLLAATERPFLCDDAPCFPALT
jgi:hypothetical protein